MVYIEYLVGKFVFYIYVKDSFFFFLSPGEEVIIFLNLVVSYIVVIDTAGLEDI